MSSIILSISLLASSRTHLLKRCLDSLRPLLFAVPSELIIVHTSENEEVKKIAESYTDMVIPFKWCDDFSAARNCGLKEAQGEWFMFIDDDEWFEDTTEIQKFFLSGMHQSYNTGFYAVRNYADWDGLRSQDYHACRLIRMTPEVHFMNPIHEELTPVTGKRKYFDAFVHHYGYIREGKGGTEKSERNIPLLLEDIEKNPKFSKNYFQLSQEYCAELNWKKAEEYCRIGYKMSVDRKVRPDISWCQAQLIYILYNMDEMEKLQEEAARILEKEKPEEIVILYICNILIRILEKKCEWKEILEYGRIFEKELGRMDRDPLMWSEQKNGALLIEEEIKRPTQLYRVRLICIKSAIMSHNEKMAEYYLKLLPWEAEYQIEQFYPVLEELRLENEELWERIMAKLPESPYILYVKALAASELKEKEELLFAGIEKSDSDWLKRQVAQEAVENRIRLDRFAARMDLETWRRTMHWVLEEKKFAEIEALSLSDIISDDEEFCLQRKYVEWMILEKELTHAFWMDEELTEGVDRYCDLILSYYYVQYKEDMLEGTSRKYLPSECRFALLLKEAMQKREEKQMVEAVRAFREATEVYPGLTGVVRELIHEMEKELKNPAQNAGGEFDALAVQMKQTIQGLCGNGQFAEAQGIVNQLVPLMPEDLELLRMRQNILRKMN